MTLKEKLKRFVKAKPIDADILSQVDDKVEKIKLDAEKKIEQLSKLELDNRELYATKEDLIKTVGQIKIPEAINGEKGERGEKGDRGEKGLDGKNGKDGKDGRDGVDGKDGITTVMQKKVPITTKDAEDIVQKIEKLPVAKRLDALKLKNLPQAVSQFGSGVIGGGVDPDKYVEVAGDTMTGDLGFSNAGINTADYIDINTSATSTSKVGRMRWNDTDRCYEFDSHVDGTIVTNQIGQELWVRVRNNTDAIIKNGKPVYVSGAVGNRPTIALAKADSETTSLTYIGLTTQDIGINDDGFVTIIGSVRGVNTNAFNAGDIVYLSSTTAGGLTTTRPVAPNVVVAVGIITVKSGDGEIALQSRIQPTLDRLSNVNISSVAEGDLIAYDSTDKRWENKSIANMRITLFTYYT